MLNIDDSIKKMLGSRKKSILTPPKNSLVRSAKASSAFSIPQKTSQWLQFAKSSIFFPLTSPRTRSPTGRLLKGNYPSFSKVSKKIFSDKDRDGFIAAADRNDNNPNNPRGAHYMRSRPFWSRKKDNPLFLSKKESIKEQDYLNRFTDDDEGLPLPAIIAIQKRKREKEQEEIRRQEELNRINKIMRKLAGDDDGDGVSNIMDCASKNKKKQDWDYEGAAEQATYVVHMAPTEYLGMTGVIGDPRNVSWLQTYSDKETKKPEPIEKLSKYINDPNKKVTIPYVEGPESKAYGFNESSREHEGRHRAYAAYLAGHKIIPVRVPIPKKERESVGREFARKKFPYGVTPEWRKELDTMDRRKYKRRVIEQQFPQWQMDIEGTQIYRGILQRRGMIPTHPYTSAAYQDWDKDGVNNLMDCDPNDPNKQGFIHNNYAYLYHGTKTNKLDEIKRQGLQPQKNYWGQDAVFLTPTKSTAEWYSKKNTPKSILALFGIGKEKEEIKPIVLSVRVPRQELQNYTDEDIIREHPTKQIKIYREIHPSDIKVIKSEKDNKPWETSSFGGQNKK